MQRRYTRTAGRIESTQVVPGGDVGIELWGRPLHAIDCQGMFCETDEYCREAAPELTSARKRIKSRFTPALGTVQ